MAVQPMGIGVRKEDFDKAIEMAAKKDEISEHQAIQQAARFLEELQKNPIVSLLVSEMESTMMRVYLESPDGQAQWRLFEKLQMGVEPSAVAKKLIRRQMVAKISNILEPQATP
jgi:hypothetical protein